MVYNEKLMQRPEKPMNEADKYYRKGKDLVTRCVAGETIIVPVRSSVGDLNSIYTLNEVSTTIWDLIDGETSIFQIIEAVSDEYDVPAEDAERDTLHFLNSLAQAGLIHCFENRGSHG
jgi:hypothetical protein